MGSNLAHIVKYFFTGREWSARVIQLAPAMCGDGGGDGEGGGDGGDGGGDGGVGGDGGGGVDGCG